MGFIWTQWPGFPDPRSRAAVQVEQIAALKVRTGALIVCDPTAAMVPEDCPPLTERFPSGDWPVLLCRVPSGTTDDATQMLCVGALVRFGTGEAVRWAEDRSHEYGVDAGAACFMDAAALPTWGWLMNTEDNPDNRLDEYGLAVGAWNEVPVEGSMGQQST
jgi:hypothetical protein